MLLTFLLTFLGLKRTVNEVLIAVIKVGCLLLVLCLEKEVVLGAEGAEQQLVIGGV